MSAVYRRNKARTFLDIIRQVENWPAAVDMRVRQQRRGLRMLNFRDGLNVVCRGGSGDWAVIHEILFAGGYGRALTFIHEKTEPCTVVDLGGNIGLFSLLAARQGAHVTVHSFEPGPPNLRLFEMNRLANPDYAERIQLHREAVGGTNATVNWFFNELNPGGSNLYGPSGTPCPVTIRAFSDVVTSLVAPVHLVKIDIEGAEYDLVRQTPPLVWEKVDAISLELHEDPAGEMSQEQFLERMSKAGYSIEEESVCSYFLKRR